MAYKSCVSLLHSRTRKTSFLASWTSASGNYTTAQTGHTAHTSQQEELNTSSKVEQYPRKECKSQRLERCNTRQGGELNELHQD